MVLGPNLTYEKNEKPSDFSVWTKIYEIDRKESMNFLRIFDFPKIPPTLRSCISELKKDFFKISKNPEKSMSKLSNKPNTIKNGHLT